MLRGAGDGKWIRDSDPIRVWDAAKGSMIASFAGFYDPIARIAWHPSNKVIATASAKGGERERGTAVRLWSMETKAMLFEHKTPGASLINGVTFHPRTGQLIWGWDGALYVFEIVGLP
jgi:WD40 repeat protein